MASSIAQQVSVVQAAASSISATAFTPAAAGDALMIVVLTNPSAAPNLTFTGATVQRYIGNANNTSGGGTVALAVFEAWNVGSSSITLTASDPSFSSSISGIYVADCTGVMSSSDPFINWSSNYQGGIGNTNPNSVTSGGVNVLGAPALLFGFSFNVTALGGSDPAVSTGSGFTSLGNVWNNGGATPTAQNTANPEYQRLTVVASTAATFTCGSNNQYDSIITLGVALYEPGANLPPTYALECAEYW